MQIPERSTYALKQKESIPADAGLPDIPKELLDQFVSGGR